MYTRVLIFTATFDFPAGKKTMFLKTIKTPCAKILDDL